MNHGGSRLLGHDGQGLIHGGEEVLDVLPRVGGGGGEAGGWEGGPGPSGGHKEGGAGGAGGGAGVPGGWGAL